MTHCPRLIKRLSGVLVILAALWFVPSASAAGYDPFDVDAAGANDPFPLNDPRFTCPFINLNVPPDFTPPEGLPPRTECVITTGNGGALNINDPSTYFKSAQTQTTGVGTLGFAGAPHAAQYIKIPVATSAAVVPLHFLGGYNAQTLPKGEPPGTVSIYHFYPRVWFLSADRKRVGELPPFRVRTLAFGSIPVQVTVHITQPRNADGSVQPIIAQQSESGADGSNPYPPNAASGGRPIYAIYRNAYAKGEVDIRLSDLLVDRHRVDVGDSCRTVSPGTLDLVGKGFYNYQDGSPQPVGTYSSAVGGLLKGTLDVPRFTDCRSASGDDVSPILTNVVSGNGNPISVNQSASSNVCYPQDDPAACLASLHPLDVPKTRPQTQPAPSGPIPVPTS